MPASASNPAGWSASVSRPGVSGALVASDSDSNVRASASGLGFGAGAGRQSLGFGDGVGDGAPMRLARGAHVGGASLERGDLRGAQLLAALHQPVVGAARAPVDLVHRPRHDRRLFQLAHALGVVAGQRLGQRVARAGELAPAAGGRGRRSSRRARTRACLGMRNGDGVVCRLGQADRVVHDDAVGAGDDLAGDRGRIRRRELIAPAAGRRCSVWSLAPCTHWTPMNGCEAGVSVSTFT